MTPAERAGDERRRLADEVRGELARMERVAGDLADLVVQLVPGGHRAVPMAVAGHLHSFYTGCEAALRYLLGAFGPLPQGAGWHRDVLFRAMSPVEGVRPSIVSPATAALLDDLLRFRHFFRASYGMDLDAGRLAAHARAVPGTLSALRREVGHFLALVEHSEREG